MVNVFAEAVSAPPAPARRAGARAAAHGKVALSVTAWVKNVAVAKKVWVDVSLLSEAGEPILSETHPLGYQEPAGGGGEFFVLDAPLSATGPASAIRYRLFYEVNGHVFTDGVLHWHQLPGPAEPPKATPKGPVRRPGARGGAGGKP